LAARPGNCSTLIDRIGKAGASFNQEQSDQDLDMMLRQAISLTSWGGFPCTEI
jgi:hypothetical protein